MLAHPALLKDTATLRKESEDLRTQSAAASGRLDQDLKTVTRLEADAEQVSVRACLSASVPGSQAGSEADAGVSVQAADGASAAFDNARNARAAVGKTLRDVSTLLANISKFFSQLRPLLAGGSCMSQSDVALNLLARGR